MVFEQFAPMMPALLPPSWRQMGRAGEKIVLAFGAASVTGAETAATLEPSEYVATTLTV